MTPQKPAEKAPKKVSSGKTRHGGRFDHSVKVKARAAHKAGRAAWPCGHRHNPASH